MYRHGYCNCKRKAGIKPQRDLGHNLLVVAGVRHNCFLMPPKVSNTSGLDHYRGALRRLLPNIQLHREIIDVKHLYVHLHLQGNCEAHSKVLVPSYICRGIVRCMTIIFICLDLYFLTSLTTWSTHKYTHYGPIVLLTEPQARTPGDPEAGLFLEGDTVARTPGHPH